MRYLFVIIFLIVSALVQAQDSTVARVSVDSLQLSPKPIVADTVAKKGPSIAHNAPDLSELVTFSEIFWTLVILLVGYFGIRFTSRVLELLAEKSTQYRITIKSLIPVVKILGWVVVIIFIVAGVFQPPAATILAFSASIGVAVGFASQDILKNIFGGIMILFDRPFNSGDKIEVGGHYGEVVEIGLRSTRILTPDDSLVSIPNSEVMNTAVSNANSGEPNCQVVAEVYLPLDIDTVMVRELATEAAQVSRYIYMNKPITVIFINEMKMGRSLYKMRLKAYVLDIRDEFKFKSEMTETVVRQLIEKGIIQSVI
ncbi:mechanosensitive ion channel family protein [Reichenbachiella ulvae]|uniref:Mechanosensitive ion channel family protein n=1 Tax=Reichenbachiella ulvae TaxID=2980104 RepID=A0ABT3CR20_9BACT|nr:mechanosensitive ion channel family protein [Reichenbachiella ulvae]MCV9385920.1 mechanosensitive ion channel family protein [Reichenbachiella ulvae]